MLPWLQINVATMPLHRLFDDCQAQPGTGQGTHVGCAMKGIKQRFGIFWRNANALVTQGNARAISCLLQQELDIAAIR